jgi:hypothetical protein
MGNVEPSSNHSRSAAAGYSSLRCCPRRCFARYLGDVDSYDIGALHELSFAFAQHGHDRSEGSSDEKEDGIDQAGWRASQCYQDGTLRSAGWRALQGCHGSVGGSPVLHKSWRVPVLPRRDPSPLRRRRRSKSLDKMPPPLVALPVPHDQDADREEEGGGGEDACNEGAACTASSRTTSAGSKSGARVPTVAVARCVVTLRTTSPHPPSSLLSVSRAWLACGAADERVGMAWRVWCSFVLAALLLACCALMRMPCLVPALPPCLAAAMLHERPVPASLLLTDALASLLFRLLPSPLLISPLSPLRSWSLSTAGAVAGAAGGAPRR